MLTLGEINEAMSDLDDWSLETNVITKIFSFDGFKEALGFVNKVSEIVIKLEHFPDIMVTNNQVRLMLTTSSVSGLTKKDFELAREIDKLGDEKDRTREVNQLDDNGCQAE
ncbi:MAG: 4a-hydroxytetrahydrobiopterin dehydratase [Nanoarchaeota archaeon]|nr:4a-hydroxytetrahydrobiopterin dehydratase [Nanoarchaeota archaeon]